MKTTIVWFREDLRVEDNPPLYYAMQQGNVVPLYIWSPEEEGAWAPGGASRVWLHSSLNHLKSSLKLLGLDLVIRKGKALEVLKEVIKSSKADQLYWSRRYNPASIERDSKIKAALPISKSFKSALLFEPWELEKSYKVFTPFYKACLKLREPDKPLPIPQKGSGLELSSLSIGQLDLLPKIHWEKGIKEAFVPGEAGAKKRLEQFNVASYAEYRDHPDSDGVSYLSPHLHFGEISPRFLWHALKGKVGSELFIRQLIWREFAHHILYHHPFTQDTPLNSQWHNFKWQGLPQDLKKWQKGETGYPIVDAGMRQLWTTGWMHNRVRMIVGSFLVKDLHVSWLEGAKWFWDTLVDADLANNTFGWQWVGGCGADAAPYFRIFNPTLQGKKFDPEGVYVKRWIPELKALPPSLVHTPWESEIKLDYPERIIDHEAARKRAMRYKEFYE